MVSHNESLPSSQIPIGFDISASQVLSYAEALISTPDGSQYFLASGLLASQALRSNVPDVSFDLTLLARSLAAYYYDTGAYQYINDKMYNCVLPASKTSGSITLSRSSGDGAEQIELDPSASLTWYDRSWGSAEPREDNSACFVLYFDNSNLVLWTWHHIHAVDVFEPNTDAAWISPRLGRRIRRNGDWPLKDAGGGVGIYMGFSTFEGVLDEEDAPGFGLSELRLAGIV
ncbi:hypothetical protein BDW71DRAFT_216704 [Aspergillus fruticulosus]